MKSKDAGIVRFHLFAALFAATLSFASPAFSDEANPHDVPEFHLSTATLTVPTNIQGFVGPSNGPSISYTLECQSFLNSNLRVAIPNTVPTQDSLKNVADNPYRSLLVAANLNKLGDTPSRLLMTAPDSRERMAALMSANNWSALTQKMMSDQQSVQLLLAIKSGELICIFYRFIDQSGAAGRMVLAETFQNIDGLYLLDSKDISAPEILNLMGALIVKGETGVTVQETAPPGAAASTTAAP